jgi:hypothetical protein
LFSSCLATCFCYHGLHGIESQPTSNSRRVRPCSVASREPSRIATATDALPMRSRQRSGVMSFWLTLTWSSCQLPPVRSFFEICWDYIILYLCSFRPTVGPKYI